MERKLLQDALKAQVRAPCVRFKAAQTRKLDRLRQRVSVVAEDLGVAELRESALRMRRLDVRSRLLQASISPQPCPRHDFTAQGAHAVNVAFDLVLHSSASDGDPDGMELALKEAEGREVELDTAQQQAHADLKRARTAGSCRAQGGNGRACANRRRRRVSQSGRSWKEQKNAAAKLQARRRGHAARGAIQELHRPACAGGGLPQSLTKRLQDADGAPRIVSKTRRADATSTAPEQLLESLTAVPELEASAPPQLQQSLATVSLLEVALATRQRRLRRSQRRWLG